MQAVLDILLLILNLYMDALIVCAILSWLIAFQVVSTRNEFVHGLWSFLDAITVPFLRPIRRFMPNTGSIDLSFLVLYFGVLLIQHIIVRYIYPNVF